MPSRSQNRHSVSFVKTAGVVLMFAMVILALTFSGVLGSLDRWLFDQFAFIQSRFSSLSSSNVLVVSSQRKLSLDECNALIEKCRQNGAGAILVLDAVVDDTPPMPEDGDTFFVSSIENTFVSEDGILRGSHHANPIAVYLTTKFWLPPLPEKFYLDFKVPRDGFPSVDISRILADDTPRDLIEGKVVLLGRDRLVDRQVTTSVHRSADTLSPLFFNALVADVIMRGGTIRSASPYYSWCFGGATFFVVGIGLHFRDYQFSLPLFLLTVTVGLVCIQYALVLAGHWVSTVGPWVLLVGLSMAATHYRELAERESLRETLRSLAVETRSKARKVAQLRARSPWMMVESAFAGAFSGSQGFALAHTAERKLVPVSEAGKQQCQKRFTRNEMRPGADPFASALREGGLVMEDNLVVVPIRTPARLIGFWVFETTDTRTISEAKKFADRIALIVENKKKVAPVESTDLPLHHQLSGAIDLLEDSRKVLANALDCSREAVLVFDPLGIPEYVSGPTVELLGNAGVEYEGLSPLDLLCQLSDAGDVVIRRGLRYVALHQREVTLMPRRDLVPGREFFLHLRPVSTGDEDLPGLVILIEDVTEIARGVLSKDEFIERFHFQLNNDFEVILSAASLIIDPRVTDDGRGQMLKIITEKIQEANGRLGQTRQHLHRDFSPEIVERFPIRLERIFEAARASVLEIAEDRQVEIDATISEYLPLVLASPKALEDLLHNILSTLIQDSRENGTVSVVVSDLEGTLMIDFRNNGFGLPEKQLNYLLESGAGGWDALERIGAARHTVSAWDGTLDVGSQVGAGIHFSLKLATML